MQTDGRKPENWLQRFLMHSVDKDNSFIMEMKGKFPFYLENPVSSPLLPFKIGFPLLIKCIEPFLVILAGAGFPAKHIDMFERLR